MQFDNHNLHIEDGFLDSLELALTYKHNVIDALKFLNQHRDELIAELRKHHLNTADIFDRRFKHSSWREKNVPRAIQQSYLKFATVLFNLIKKNPSLDPQTYFLFEFLINALSPSNIPLLNPETKNIKHGLNAFLSDVKKWSGYPLITKCERDAFEVGKTIATTAGSVIFQNELIQLIQYQATTEKVHRAPILLVTSWVNKFYILDLRKEHSLIRWLVSQGYTVFVISWINPDKKLRHKDFYDYVDKGVIQSLKIIRDITNHEKINLFGFCLGGTLVSAALAILAKENLDWILSTTLIATLIDFSKAGPIKQFMGEEQIRLFEKFMRQHGFMHGYKTLVAFQLIAANENIWPFWVKHYLQGKKTLSLDTLFWSLDITHSTEALYRFYMRKLLQENTLVHRCKKISVPVFYVAFKEDWLSPAQGCFDSCKLFIDSHDKTFLLAPGGHLSGITTKPTEHSQQTINIKSLAIGETFEQWQNTSESSNTSWHIHWQQWLSQLNSDWVDARTIAASIEAAPGSYVRHFIW